MDDINILSNARQNYKKVLIQKTVMTNYEQLEEGKIRKDAEWNCLLCRRLNQAELSDLGGDLSLPKEKATLLWLRLEQD